eukprot:gb/GECG01015971.1/.p1 GENE.gb/GECG01015971.1/~~gb/GECG01015971.1/.p1  ORF type:complete len:880 (+),score=124.31 gb/GECG01015971.1/:1-2640(+)
MDDYASPDGAPCPPQRTELDYDTSTAPEYYVMQRYHQQTYPYSGDAAAHQEGSMQYDESHHLAALPPDDGPSFHQEGEDEEEDIGSEESGEEEDDPFSPPKRSQPLHISFEERSLDSQPEEEMDDVPSYGKEKEKGSLDSQSGDEMDDVLSYEKEKEEEQEVNGEETRDEFSGEATLTTPDMEMDHGVLDEAMSDTHISSGNQFAPLAGLESHTRHVFPVTTHERSPPPEEAAPPHTQPPLHPHDLKRLGEENVKIFKKVDSVVRAMWSKVIEQGTTILKPTVVFLRGIPGIGKSSAVRALGDMCVDVTFPNEIAPSERRELVENLIKCGRTDRWVTMDLSHEWTWLAVCSADHHFETPEGYKMDAHELGNAHESAQLAFRKALAANIPLIIVDNTNTQQFEINNYMDALGNAEANPIVVEQGIPTYVPEIQPINVVTLEFVCPNEITAVYCYARCAHGVPLEKCLKMWQRWETPAPNTVYIRPGGVAKALWSAPAGTDPLYFTKLLASEALKTTSTVDRNKAQRLMLDLQEDIMRAENLLPIEKVLYAGIMLSERSSSLLQQMASPQFEEVCCDHVTISFRPKKPLLGELPVGKKVTLECNCEVSGREVQAVPVTPLEHSPLRSQGVLQQSANGISANLVPHVTISKKMDVKAKGSNELLERWHKEAKKRGESELREDWRCRQFARSFQIEGTVGVTVGKDHPYGGHSERRIITDEHEYRKFCSTHQIRVKGAKQSVARNGSRGTPSEQVKKKSKKKTSKTANSGSVLGASGSGARRTNPSRNVTHAPRGDTRTRKRNGEVSRRSRHSNGGNRRRPTDSGSSPQSSSSSDSHSTTSSFSSSSSGSDSPSWRHRSGKRSKRSSFTQRKRTRDRDKRSKR